MDETTETIIVNAERLLADARTLADVGSFRTAISLAVLSFEESGKACLLHWQKAGFISGATERLKHHIEKQRVFLSYRSISAARKFGVLRPAGSIDQYENFSSNIKLSKAFSAEHQSQVLIDLIAINMNMNDYLKESGFYVDIDEDLNVKRSHTTFDEKQFKPQADRAEEAIRMAREPLDIQKIMAVIYASNVHLNLDGKQRRTQQKNYLDVMETLFEAGVPRPVSEPIDD